MSMMCMSMFMSMMCMSMFMSMMSMFMFMSMMSESMSMMRLNFILVKERFQSQQQNFIESSFLARNQTIIRRKW